MVKQKEPTKRHSFKQTAFRLTDDDKKVIDRLKKKFGDCLTTSSIIRLAIRAWAKQEGLT